MADQESKTINGVLGRLPPWPRNALSPSVIAAEQAYRKRSGLPQLTEEEVERLKAGQPLPWEAGGAPAAPATPAPAQAPPAAAQAPAAAAPAAPPSPGATTVAAAGGQPSAVAEELMKSGRKWSRSSIAAEQAYRRRKGLPHLTDADITYLLGEEAPAAQPAAPTPAAPTPAASAAAPAAARPAAAPATPMAPSITRQGAATKYVGTPAVGTSQAAAAGGLAAIGPVKTEINRKRRRLVWAGVAAFLAAWLIAFFRFFLPRTLFEPATSFKIGYAADYGLGVDTKWQQKYRIWVDRTPDRLFVIYARCTHLGCTPDWKPSEYKFKCPCHGSGYDSEGINFEGPAPRPMDRAHVELAPDGQVVVDVSRLYAWPKGQPSQFDNPGAFIPT